MLRRYLVAIAALFMLYHGLAVEAGEQQVIVSSEHIGLTPRKRPPPERLHQTRSSHATNEILQAINGHRRNVDPGPSSNMEYIEWDSNFEVMASDWAELCSVTMGALDNYTPYGYAGQSLYVTDVDGPTVVDAINYWNDQGEYFTYETNSCDGLRLEECGQYLNNVMATYNRIGCGRQFCEDYGDGSFPWNEGTIIVCYYGPGAAEPEGKPYLIGYPCDECYSAIADCSTEIGEIVESGEAGLCRTPCDLECKNGGTCYTSLGFDFDGAFCHCLPHWTGHTCTEEVICETPCENDGVCILSLGLQICDCSFGFLGDACEIEPTCDLYCHGDNGVCDHYSDGSEYCICNTGWTGLDCNTPYVDTEPPVIQECPSDIMLPTLTGVIYTNAAIWTAPEATDNNGEATVLQTSGPVSGSNIVLGEHTIVYTATDDAGNSDSCQFKVTIFASTCTVICENGGSCFFDESYDEDRCYCPYGFTGPTCRRITMYCCPPAGALSP